MLDEHGGATATKTGQMIGTPAFMPPEQALSKPKEIDKQTDIWAVGATMFTLLSGELVHIAESSSEHLVKAATLHARSVARVLPGIPANVETLVGRALRFEKKDRWTSATEMRRELWRVRLDPGRPIGTTSAPPPRNPASNFPTVQRHDSDKPSLREMGMAMTGEHRIPASRRAVFFSTLAAVLLVAGAITFGIYMTLGQKPQLVRPAVAAAGPAENGGGFLPTGLTDNAGNDPALQGAGATPAATGLPTTATSGAPTTSASATTTTTAAAVKPAAQATTNATSPKPAGKRAPATAATGDIYKPF
jgi:serine/threonine-protein kinase